MYPPEAKRGAKSVALTIASPYVSDHLEIKQRHFPMVRSLEKKEPQWEQIAAEVVEDCLLYTSIKDKTTDPAVIVMDEKANHVISLLSGHLGGANQVTLKIAELLDSNPVITTATDTQNVVALDLSLIHI